jgi:drug/metabolite transporter (DMT)-like permease
MPHTAHESATVVRGAAFGLGAAALFGLSAPIAKRLLADAEPLVLAGLLYAGGGIALSTSGIARRLWGSSATEAPLERREPPGLIAIILVGGVAGPLLMLIGLGRVSGVAGALLLNLEGPLTVVFATLIFREHLGVRAGLSGALVFAGAAVLAVGGPPGEVDLLGVAALAGACACWALDNNLTQLLSLKDPLALARFKTLGAGLGMLAMAGVLGQPFPRGAPLAAALAVGGAAYGASLLLDVYALRLLGAAREAAFFATAPFIGAMAAVPILGESPGPAHAGAALAMASGVALLLRERHSHMHTHEPIEHTHLHVHDLHHRHSHEGPVTEPHAHPHRHERVAHEHPHLPDVHHRHPHG